ncbi:hypothetical protein chiPu_0025696 [Chiloscyllium punctatum]|uniref:C-type lectin domain-containing protein n=1 Tax=Chiloscyllium punctatum TaxID=137246 RepID=A0A401TGY9_CHIPU|nr:hypothetical protein [Chiloscyllium punctatum]
MPNLFRRERFPFRSGELSKTAPYPAVTHKVTGLKLWGSLISLSLLRSYWSLGEPDNSMGKRCVRMTVDGRWRSEQCGRHYPYICQVHSIDYVVQQLQLPLTRV